MTSAAHDVESAIRQAGDQWVRYWNARQLDQLAALYSADAVYLPPHHAAVSGREAIRDYLRHAIQNAADVRFDVSFIRHAGDLAYDVGTYSMTVPQQGGGTRIDRGKYLVVWHREGGAWKIAADSWSSDLPPSDHAPTPALG